MHESLSQDLRYSVRSILANPIASLTVVLSLGIGMGITSTAFSILNAMALADLPGVVRQDRLVTFAVSFQGEDARISGSRFSRPDVEVLQAHPELFSAVAAAGPMQIAVDAGGGAELVEGELVTPGYFSTLGARPALGRFFNSSSGGGKGEWGGETGVAVMSHRFWEARFAQDPGVVGRVLRVNGHPLQIIGVAQEGFTGMTAEDVVEGARAPLALWIPTSMAASIRPSWTGPDPLGIGSRWFRPLARLAEGVSQERLAAALPGLAREMETLHPDARAGAEIIHGDLVFGPGTGPWRPTLTILGFMVVPIIVLLVACANAANVLLARNASRRRELAIRKALGASRGVLVRQLLVESGLLALASGSLGLLVAMGARAIAGLFTLHLSMAVPLDWRVFSFALAASLSTGLLFGLGPALRATRKEISGNLAASGRGASQSRGDSRLRDSLVVAQVALGLLLLVSSGLFVRSAQAGLKVDTGIQDDRLLLLDVDLDLLGYESAAGEAFYDRLLPALRGIPGVEEVALADQPPLQGYPSARVAPSGGDPSRGPRLAVAHVGDRILEASGLGLQAGRTLTEADERGGARVAILNEAAARRLWPGQNPLGNRLRLDEERDDREIVGIVRDSRTSLSTGPEPIVYLPRGPEYQPRATVYVRTTGDPRAAADQVRGVIRRIDPRVPVQGIEPAREVRSRMLAPWRLGSMALGGLGAIAAMLAGAGLFGVLAYSVALRTREIGVRMALGATRSAVSTLVLLSAARLVGLGMILGFLMASAVATLLRAGLFGVSPIDPWVYGEVACLMTGITVVAALLPALRASRIEPVRVLGGN